MSKIKTYDQFNESYLDGHKAPLYHTTNVYHAAEIINTDSLVKCGPTGPGLHNSQSYKVPPISFTRDPNFKYLDELVTFKLDAVKLGSKFKIMPFDYLGREHHPKGDPDRNGDFEFEETVNKDIHGLHKYLMEIQLNMTELVKMKEEKTKNSVRSKEEYYEAYQDLVKAISDYSAKYKIKLKDYKGKDIELSDLNESGIWDDIDLQKEFDDINKKAFDGKLNKVPLKFISSRGSSGMMNSTGKKDPRTGRKYDEVVKDISISTYYNKSYESFGTYLHTR